MLTQAQIAKAWGEHCYSGPKLAITLHGGGVVTVRPVIGDAVLALDACLRKWGYDAYKADTGGFNCRPKTGSTETSNHGRAIAIDIDWATNPYGRPPFHSDMPSAMVLAICRIVTNSGKQVWNNGRYWSGNVDPMHFEIVCSPADLATGIRASSVPVIGPAPAPPPPAPDWTALRKAEAAGYLTSAGALPTPMSGSSNPNFLAVIWLERVLNLIMNIHLAEDGVYGDAVGHAVWDFQQYINATGHPINDIRFPGEVSVGTKLWIAKSLENIVAGQ